MSKITIIFLTLINCSTVFAEPILYVCERPTWGKDEGCGPNNTRYTYGFSIDTNVFDLVAVSEKSKSKGWNYVFTETRGCDLSRATGKQGTFWVTDQGFIFRLGRSGREVELHTTSMNAKILGAAVKHSPYMTCEEVKGEKLKVHPGPWTRPGGFKLQPTILDPQPTDHSDQ